MGPEPAWAITTSRVVRHVIPGIAVILGGFMLLPRLRASRPLGATLALLGGVWITVAPVVLGRGGEGTPALVDVLRPLAYHFGTGLLITALAGFAIGWAIREARTQAAIGSTQRNRERAQALRQRAAQS